MSVTPLDDSRAPLDLLIEDFLQRIRKGDSITPEGFAKANPQHADDLLELLPALLVLEQAKRERETSASGARRASVPKLEQLGEFRILREVGRGGMGVVFEAVQESLGRHVALKVLPQASLLSGNQLERFRREAKVAANLHHTHIVPVYGSGEADGYHYYAMQFIAGRGLDGVISDLIDQKPALLPTDRALRAVAISRIGEDVAQALHHAHELGTMHRDVKPANLLMEPNGHVWVTDFGLAKALQYDGLTHSGDVLGTLQYLAPEQLAGIYDVRSEVYSLGLVLYELLALRPAFRAETRSELLEKIRAGRCEPLQKACVDIPRDLATIVERAIAVEPVRRYGDALSLALDLRAFIEDRPIAARRTSQLEHAWRWCRRNRALAAASLLALVATFGAAVVGWTSYLVTDDALLKAKSSAQEALAASSRTESNLLLTLAAFEGVFDALVGPDPLHAIVDDDNDDAGSVVAMRSPVDKKDAAVLQRMLNFYDKFAEQNENSIGLREQSARAYRRVGGIQARLSNIEGAIVAYQKSLQLYRDVPQRDAVLEIATVQQELGQAYLRLGRVSDARIALTDALRLLEANVADGSHSLRLLRAQGHFLMATIFDLRSGGNPAGGPPGGPGGPQGRRGLFGLAELPGGPPGNTNAGPQGRGSARPEMVRDMQQQLRAAQVLLTDLLKETPEAPDVLLLQARVLIANLRPTVEGPQKSESADRATALAILTKLVEGQPDNDVFRFELAEALMSPPQRNLDAKTLSQILTHATQLVLQQPTNLDYQSLLARAHKGSGRALRRSKDLVGAERELRAAIAIEEPLAEIQSRSLRFQEGLIQSRLDLAKLLLEQEKVDDARTQLTFICDQFAVLAERNGPPPRSLSDPERIRELLDLLQRVGLTARGTQIRKQIERRGR
ncbi:MAG: serine/threonine-protein kinase [Planctomycetota bacterium]|nr:serine/threonine-protein kinase [Planctomycetota bacterium]